MILYKYMPSDRFFQNLKLRFTPAEDLNDPRELIPDIRLKNPSEYATNIVQRNLSSTYFRFLFEHPEISTEEAWRRISTAAQQFTDSFDYAEKTQEIFNSFMRVTNRNVGVLSLTESPDNELMWAHYANSYDGFVVGFDSEDEFFRPKRGEPKLCGELMNVIYSDTRPVVYVEPGKMDIPKEVFFTKTTKWSYEREWRIIKYLDMANEIKDVSGKKIHLFDVSPSAVKEVIFGEKVSQGSRDAVEGVLRAKVPHVIYKKVRFDQAQGLLVENV